MCAGRARELEICCAVASGSQLLGGNLRICSEDKSAEIRGVEKASMGQECRALLRPEIQSMQHLIAKDTMKDHMAA